MGQFFRAAFKIKLFTYLIAFISQFAFAQISDPDSLVNIEDLNFDIAEEKENFIFTDNSHIINLLYYTDNYNIDKTSFESFKTKYFETADLLKQSIEKIKKHDKQIKLIYKTIHENFLSKYEELVDFYQIVTNGVYNCVTATALYAITLDELKIPYSIKERPGHVYLIAFPKMEQILMESTSPTRGYVYFNNDYKNLFVQNLRKSKLISEQEFRSQNVNALFEKYYYFDKDINLQQLISIHYSNNAYAYFEKEEHRMFHEQIRKASYLYPSPRNTFLLFSSTVLLLEHADYSNEQEIDNLVFLSRFIDKGISAQHIINEFTRITYEYLDNSSRPNELDPIYEKLLSAAVSEEFNKELTFIFNYEKGRYYLIKGQYLLSYPYVKKAFELNSGNAGAQTNLINNLSNLARIERSKINELSEMDSLLIQYPVLMENNNFIQIYGWSQLQHMEEYFKNKDPENGNKVMTSFEALLESNPIIDFPDNLIGRAYSEAAVYYFKKGQNKTCRIYLNKGLDLAPNSNEIKSRLVMLR